MHPHNMYSLKMEIAKSYQKKDIKDYIKLEIENEKKINELIKNCKTKDPLLHKQYVKNIKKLLLKDNNNNKVMMKRNYKCLDQRNIIKNDNVEYIHSVVIYDTTE